LVCTDPKSCIAQGGADANAEDAGGQKAIHAAAAEQHRDIVELLLPQTTPDDDNAADWTVDGATTPGLTWHSLICITACQ